MQQQPDGVFVLAQAHSVEDFKGGPGAALQAELSPQSGLQEVVLPDVPGEERDGERHHSPSLQQHESLFLCQLAVEQIKQIQTVDPCLLG